MNDQNVPNLFEQVLFTSGQDEYHSYRIPALAVAVDGTLLAFCEGRIESARDDAEIQIVLRRSGDNGSTWGEIQVITSDDGHTVGNPCVVVDRSTGSVWLAFCKDNDRVFITESPDNGANWSEPSEITQQVKRPDWIRYGSGPGHGIQTSSGRMLMPSWHTTVFQMHIRDASHIFFSDDHGKTWQLGEDLEDGSNECEIVELSDGSLYMTARNGIAVGFGLGVGAKPVYPRLVNRLSAVSDNDGQSWSQFSEVPELKDPICQASIVRYPKSANQKISPIIFSNPASFTRENLSIGISYDDCLTWSRIRTLKEGPAGYSDLAVLNDQAIGCAYEWGTSAFQLTEEQRFVEHISFARFNIDWLV